MVDGMDYSAVDMLIPHALSSTVQAAGYLDAPGRTADYTINSH